MRFFRNKPVSETDEELLEQYRKTNDSFFFGQLYDRYIPLIYGLCLKYLQNADEAEDAVMQLFELIVNKVLNQDIQVFRNWIYTVTKNHCLHLLAARKKDLLTQVELHENMSDFDNLTDLLGEDEDEERLKMLETCIEMLPEHQKVSIKYFFIDQLSYVEIAEKTGYPINKVKSYIQNGKRNLAISLQKQER